MMNPAVQDILDKHIDNIAGVRGAVVLSEDGLPRYWSLYDEETAVRRAPLAASLGNLAARTASEEGGGAVHRTMIDMEDGFFIVARSGVRSFLAVSAREDADLGRVAYEVALLTQRLANVLDTDSREPDADSGEPSEGGALA